MDKPPQIIKLEKEYGIKLTQKNKVGFSHDDRNCYSLNAKGEADVLNLSRNLIPEIRHLEGLTGLTQLDLSNNRISEIRHLEGLTGLTQLDLRSNNISEIRHLESLTGLTQLDLSDNPISEIKNLEGLTSLTQLYLILNNISEIKNLEGLLNLKKLETLCIYDNPFEKKLVDFKFSPGVNNLDELKDYFKLANAEDKKEIKPTLKVMLLGNHASGKSTFLRYFLDNAIPTKKAESTHILRIEGYPKDGEREAVFYDFGGQDYYHGIYKAFMTNNSLNLIFWKLESDKNSHGDDANGGFTQNFDRRYWIKQISHYGKENSSWLVQTHTDTDARKALIDENLQELIADEYHLSITNPIKPHLKALKESLEEKIKNRETISISQSYIEFVDKILNDSKDSAATDISALRKEFEAVKEKTGVELEFALDQLSKQGFILHYPNIEKLKNIAWLSPQAVVEKIHKEIFEKEEMKKRQGVVAKEDFEQVASDEHIRLMLLENKVIFFDDTDRANPKYIIPGYLPTAKEKGDEFFYFTPFNKPQLTLKFEYFIPFGLINQLICHYGKTPELKRYWRDMLLFTLDDKKTQALIKLDFGSLKIGVYVSSSMGKTRVRDITQNVFEDIMAFYYDDTGRLGDIVTTKEKRDEIERRRREYPDDMHISLDGNYFVHYNTLNDDNQTKESITAHKLTESFGLELKKAVAIPTRGFAYIAPDNKELKKMKKIFISYSKKNVEYKDRLAEHLKLLKIFQIADSWDDGKLPQNGGGEWDESIKEELDSCDMIVYMLSVDFFGSSYMLNEEVANILNTRHDKKILCVLVCDFPDIYGVTKGIEMGAYNQDNVAMGALRLSKYQIAPYDDIKNNHTGDIAKRPSPICQWEPNRRDKAYSQIVETISVMLKN